MYMNPAMVAWWQRRRAAQCGPHAEQCGPHGAHGHGHGPEHAHHPGGAWAGGWGPFGGGHFGGGGGSGDELGGGGFGVRRPLRFLAYKLELEEAQVTELARILNDLKTERAQAAVDDRRTTSAFADAIAEDTWDDAKVLAAAEVRVKTAQQLRDAVVKALGRIHALLEPGQRAKLAYLIRTGTLSI